VYVVFCAADEARMTPYALLLEACGLGHRQASDLHLVSLDTVKSWSLGRNAAPPGAVAELRALATHIEHHALTLISDIRGTGQRAVILQYPLDDATAKAWGFPCVGAWRAMMRRVVAQIEVRVEFHVARAISAEPRRVF
jgi:hypothetical protein